MFGLLGRTAKNLVKNTVVGAYTVTKTTTGFIGSSIETAKAEAVDEKMTNFEQQLAFLPEDERKAVLALAKQKRLEKLAEDKSKLVVQQLQQRASQKSNNMELTPEQLMKLASMLKG